MRGYTALSSARMNTDRVEHSPAYRGQVRRRSIARMPSWSTANLRIGRGEGVAVTFSSLPPRSQAWISQRGSVTSGAGAVESMWAASRNASAHRHRSEPCDSRRIVSKSSWGKVCRSGTPLKSDMACRMALSTGGREKRMGQARRHGLLQAVKTQSRLRASGARHLWVKMSKQAS